MQLTKTLKIGNEEYTINTSAYIKIAVYNEFNFDVDELLKDYGKQSIKLQKLPDIEKFLNFDFSLYFKLYQMLYIMLKIASPDRFKSFEDFSLMFNDTDLKKASVKALMLYTSQNVKDIPEKVRTKKVKKKKKGN